MPASRSRTDHWWDCLRKVHDRGGAIEISIAREPPYKLNQPDADGAPSDLVWRVRIVSLSPTEVLVEQPAAFGASLELRPGIALIGAMTIGQNRWMFHTGTVESRSAPDAQGRACRCLVLSAPTGVERCTRRNFYRTSTAGLRLPEVQCWPLLDPVTVLAAETANRLAIEHAFNTPTGGAGLRLAEPEQSLLPDVGPAFGARLLNLSGGGLGLRIERSDAGAIERRHHLWLRVDLRPDIPAPIAVTARLAHTHIDSEQNLYAGMAFDFAYNPGHRAFVLALFAKYLDALQNRQRLAA